MDAIQKKTKWEKLILLALAVLCVIDLVLLFSGFSVMRLLWLAVTAFLIWLLLRDGKEELYWYAFLALAVVAVIGFFTGVSQGSYRLVGGHSSTTSFFTVLPGLLVLVGFLGLTALGSMQYAAKFPALGDKLRQGWYVPALLFAVALVYALLLNGCVSLFGGRVWWPGFRGFFNVRLLLWGIIALLLGLSAAGQDSLPSRSTAQEAPRAAGELRYCSVAKLLFLSFITLGIWALIWLCRVTTQLNAYEDRHPRKSWHELIFCLLLPFYYIYWTYKSAQLLEKAAGKEGDRFGVLCLACAALVPPVGMALIQDRINALADAAEEAAQGIEVELYEEAEDAPAEEVSAPVVEDDFAPDSVEAGEAFVRAKAAEDADEAASDTETETNAEAETEE